MNDTKDHNWVEDYDSNAVFSGYKNISKDEGIDEAIESAKDELRQILSVNFMRELNNLKQNKKQ